MSSITVLSQHRERQSPFRQETPYISIIIPMYNEQEVLAACHERVCSVLDKMSKHCEIIYIDDGSSDESWNIASQLGSKHHSIKTIRLSRNFGKEAAMSAGLNYFNAYRSGRLPMNLIQAQRDHFGSHTYERMDREGVFHTEW